MEHAVFINYRGEDSHSYGALLYRDLSDQFGEDLVFLDAESIPAGADFVEELLGRVRSARVVLAVIGPRWLTATDTTGRRRIDDPADWIRRELAEAFAAGVRVIPVLTDQAELPAETELPVDIAALSRCQYRHLRRREPTSDLARIVADLTSLDPFLAATARSRDTAPRQLPAAPGLFTGRTAELAALSDATTTTSDAGPTVVISAIGGIGGIGKTALALHWAYQQLHRFPDGQLYVDLRGFDPSGQPTYVNDAARGFLVGLGLDLSTLPDDVDALVACYRSAVAGKRMLIVLDNAADVDQVTPLLPGSPTCTVLVTSRRHLAGLTLHGAHLLDLDVLPEPDSRGLLTRHLGLQRLAAEPEAVTELLAICAGLPLAVRIVAARAQQHPAFRLAVLAKELRDTSARLAGLDAGDLHGSLRAVLSWSFHTLDPEAAGLFRLLGIAPGPDISLPAAVSLAGVPEQSIRMALQALELASLVQQHTSGRYRMHDLIRAYARDTARHLTNDDEQDAALRRITDFYLYTARSGARHIAASLTSLELGAPVLGCVPDALADHPAALKWFAGEHDCLSAAQELASNRGWHTKLWQLTWVSSGYYWEVNAHFRLGRSWRDVISTGEDLGDPAILAVAHQQSGRAVWHIGLAARDFKIGLGEPMHEIEANYRKKIDAYRSMVQIVKDNIELFPAGTSPDDLAQHVAEGAMFVEQFVNDMEGALACFEQVRSLSRDGAISHYQQAIRLFRDVNDVSEEARTLEYLAAAYIDLGLHAKGRDALRSALELYQAHGPEGGVLRTQQQLDELDHHDAAAESNE